MKKIKITEAQSMSVESIETKVVELKKELLNLRFQLATGNLENTAEIKSVKVNIAILKTVLTDKK
ncbi:MAG: 50S ribosomal protein L29 [Spiroplasma sp.]|nr:50S ribosomal protein L29 [Mycoplasmatales bacterium]